MSNVLSTIEKISRPLTELVKGFCFLWAINNIVLTGIKFAVGLLFNSPVLIADGVHNAGDVYASIAAVIGIGLAMIGDHYHIAFLSYGDPIAGIVVAYFVLKLAAQEITGITLSLM